MASRQPAKCRRYRSHADHSDKQRSSTRRNQSTQKIHRIIVQHSSLLKQSPQKTIRDHASHSPGN